MAKYYAMFNDILWLCFGLVQLSRILAGLASFQMNDEKTAADYKVQGGSVLHLVLALRGGEQ